MEKISYTNKKKILFVFGTRPEAIKIAPVLNEIKNSEKVTYEVCTTGQHSDLLDNVLRTYKITPTYKLNIMTESQKLEGITAKIMQKLPVVLGKSNPDLVVVHGDTTTAMATAMCCFYKQIPIAHIEAGLRSNNLFSPFPEEFNRRVISLISTYNFCPTDFSAQNLIGEKINSKNIYTTGNTVIEASVADIKLDWENKYVPDEYSDRRLVVLTAHRRENIPHLKEIFESIKRIAEENKDIYIVYPVHPNPVVKTTAEVVLGGVDNIRLVEPINAVDFHNLMYRSLLVITDSGGLQEEASALKVPICILRTETERPEGVSAGFAKLVGNKADTIYEGITEVLQNTEVYFNMLDGLNNNCYGDGTASEKIVEILETI